MMTDQAAAQGKTPEQVLEETIQRQGIRRLGTTEDVAELAVFLCLPQARHIQGTAISVDGGGPRACSDLDAMRSPAPDVERWSAMKVWLFSLFNKNPESNLSAVDRIGLDSDDRFLDLGCGLGAALEQRPPPGRELRGSIPVHRWWNVLRSGFLKPRCDSAHEAIPFEDDTFTAALSVSTYHHWADAETGLKAVRRVLAPGGRLLIVERKLKGAPATGWRHGGDSLAQLLEGRGYVSVQVETMKIGREEYLAVAAVVP